MGKHTGMTRGFSQLSKAWYGDSCLNLESIKDRINIGFYSEHEPGTTGEFSIVWQSLGGKWVPLLRAYDDSWHALYRFRDVLKKLAMIDDENYSADELAQLLISCGIKDMTKTEDPYKKPRSENQG